MRLWHQDLISKLPNAQLRGQHRECCALRGNGWGKKHSTVDYIFNYTREKLICYHILIMNEIKRHNICPNLDIVWYEPDYRGKNCEKDGEINSGIIDYFLASALNIYKEHDYCYYQECIENLKRKGIEII